MNSKYLIPRLLSGRNRLSRIEKDQIFDDVLRQVAPERKPLVRRGALMALVGAAAAIVLIPLAMRDGEEAQPDFTPRGQAASVAALEVSCGADEVCNQGDKLLFDLSQTTGYRYFAAFSKREDGTVIWYFPELPEGTSLDLDQRLTDGVLDRGVVLGDHHQPGRYRIYGVFSNTPLTRDRVRDRFDEQTTGLGPDGAAVVREVVVR